MKKIISVLLVVIMTVSAISVANFTANTTTKTITRKNANYQYTISNDKVEIKKYIGNSSNVSIPSKIENKKVTSIGSKAFYGNNKLKSVHIPTTVETIRGLAFDSCVNIKSVIIPNSVKMLGNAVFFSCVRLHSVTLSKNLQSIGKACFYNCSKLKSITLPSSLKNIGAYIFGDCKSLDSLVINNGPTYISREMFLNCNKLKKIVLPKSITKISRKSFSNCISLSDINITDRITHIGSKAFSNCIKLKEIDVNTKNIYDSTFYNCTLKKVILGDKVTNIQNYAFGHCNINTLYISGSVKNISGTAFISSDIKNLSVDDNNSNYLVLDNVIFSKDKKKIIASVQQNNHKNYNIPNGVEEICDNAFYGKNITEVTFPNTVTKIGQSAFMKCNILTKVNIPNSVTDIEESAFCNCNELKQLHLPENLTVLNKNVLMGCNEIDNLVIPDSVKKIYSGAFGGYCKSTFNIPKNVTSISSTAFGSSNDIKDITVDNENKNYSSVNGMLYSKDKKILKIYPQGRYDSTINIPKGTEEISSRAFYFSQYLSNITIPSTVKKIDDFAISYMPNIQFINIPSSVKSIAKKAIGYGLVEGGNGFASYNLIITGSKNTAAEKYSKANNILFYTNTPKQNVKKKSLAGGKSFVVKVSNINQDDLVFSSSNDKIATVDNKGKVTGIRKGTTNIIASINSKNFFFKITVTSNAKKRPKTFDDSSYYKITNNNYKSWTKDYYKFNNKIKYTKTDNPNINCYSSNNYIYMHAMAGSKKHIKQAKENVGDDYDQYIYFLYGTNMELSRFKLHKNTVFYRGSSDVSNITGTSYTLKDMKKAIGRTYTDKTLVSASINHDVAVNFSDDNKGAVLEIYAPKHIAVCGYIERISEFSNEQEMLFASNTKFKVIDAGVRKVTYDNLTIGEKETKTERFMKLLVVK